MSLTILFPRKKQAPYSLEMGFLAEILTIIAKLPPIYKEAFY